MLFIMELVPLDQITVSHCSSYMWTLIIIIIILIIIGRRTRSIDQTTNNSFIKNNDIKALKLFKETRNTSSNLFITIYHDHHGHDHQLFIMKHSNIILNSSKISSYIHCM